MESVPNPLPLQVSEVNVPSYLSFDVAGARSPQMWPFPVCFPRLGGLEGGSRASSFKGASVVDLGKRLNGLCLGLKKFGFLPEEARSYVVVRSRPEGWTQPCPVATLLREPRRSEDRRQSGTRSCAFLATDCGRKGWDG